MRLIRVRNLFPKYWIFPFPKEDYKEGVTCTEKNKRSFYRYEEVYLVESKESRRFFLLYPLQGHFTGSFDSRDKAVDWFRNGGR